MAEQAQQPRPCPRCGEDHEIFACPHVKAVEFDRGLVSGEPFLPPIRRIEFLTPADCVARRSPDAGEPPPDYPRKGQR